LFHDGLIKWKKNRHLQKMSGFCFAAVMLLVAYLLALGAFLAAIRKPETGKVEKRFKVGDKVRVIGATDIYDNPMELYGDRIILEKSRVFEGCYEIVRLVSGIIDGYETWPPDMLEAVSPAPVLEQHSAQWAVRAAQKIVNESRR
jgi:hypothetical protein